MLHQLYVASIKLSLCNYISNFLYHVTTMYMDMHKKMFELNNIILKKKANSLHKI